MSSFVANIGIGLLLALIQVLAFLPWALALASETVTLSLLKNYTQTTASGGMGRIPAACASLLAAIGEVTGRLLPVARQNGPRQQLMIFAGGVAGLVVLLGAAFALLLPVIQEKGSLERLGRLYGAALQLQLVFDVFVLAFGFTLIAWPKGGAVAVAAFREAIRQPMFWLFLGGAVILMFVFTLLPYFTFGEYLVMMTEIDFDIIMALAVIFGVFTASISISDEIEGRTAITLMSKPLSRRQFLLGKYLGILLACLVMTLLLGWLFNWAIIGKKWFDKQEYDAKEPPPALLV